MRGFLITLWIFWLLVTQVCLGSDRYGLLFKSYDYPQNERTSFDLTGDRPFNDAESQALTFDLSIWEADKFGYIFRSLDKNQNKLDLLYIPQPDSIYLKIVYNESQELIAVGLSAIEVLRNQWHSLSIRLDEGIELQFNEHTFRHNQSFALKTLVFGLNYNTKNTTIETLPFAIRNATYQAEGKVIHHWPLNETSGSTAHDQKGNRNIQILNPSWLSSKYEQWEEKIKLKGDKVPALTYRSNAQTIQLISESQMEIYWIGTGAKTQMSYPSIALGDEAKNGIYNHLTNELLLYDLQPVNLFTLNESTKSWTSIAKKQEVKQQIWKHTSFISSLDSSLFLFGGYGFFTMKNDFWKYSRSQRAWNKIPLKGDPITPRYHVSSGKGLRPGQAYIFGGIGNESGKQELGQQNFYDLFLINTVDSTATKIWELPSPEYHFLPTRNLVVNPLDSSFYTLCYRNFDTDNRLALIHFSLTRPEYEVLADSIPFSLVGIDLSDVMLQMNEPTQELFASVRMTDENDESEATVYALLFPPKSPTIQENQEETGIVVNPKIGWFFIVLGIVVLFVIIRRSIKRSSSQLGHSLSEKDAVGVAKTQIYLLGGFTVISNQKDMSKSFSPKLRELLLLLLAGQSTGRTGITTKELTGKLWPLTDTGKAKNARGVTIQRLRKVLEEVDDVQLVHEQDLWSLELGAKVYCDFLYYHRLKEMAADHRTPYIHQQMISILKRGPLLPNMQLEWLDIIKGSFVNEVIDSQLNHAEQLDLTAEAEAIQELAGVILTHDDLNDHGIQLKVKSLVQLGKHGLAKTEFDRFLEKYEKVFGEVYDKSFQDLMD